MLFMGYGKEICPDAASRKMGQLSLTMFGWSMTISDWRHINIGWKRHLVKGSIDSEIEDDSMSDVHAEQSGHSPVTEQRMYGLAHDIAQGISEDRLHIFLNASVRWQHVLQVPPCGTRLPYHKSTISLYTELVGLGKVEPPSVTTKSRDEGTTAQLITLITQLQASQDTANKKLLDKVEHLSMEVKNLQETIKLMEASKGKFADLLSALEEEEDDDLEYVSPPLSQCPLPPSEEDIDHALRSSPVPPDSPVSEQLVELPTLVNSQQPVIAQRVPETSTPQAQFSEVEAQLLVHLASITSTSDAQWRTTAQRDAVAALLSLDQDVIIALRTGLGKTAIVLLSHFLEDGVTIVVLPLIALMDDWKRRLDKVDIPYTMFRGSQQGPLSPHSKIILVSSDMVRKRSWRNAIALLQKHRTVTRVVFDECHFYFTDVNFRKQALANASAIRIDYPAQWVLLSATLPPACEDWLKEEFSLKDPLVIRSSSARPELKYHLLPSVDSIARGSDTLQNFLMTLSTTYTMKPEDRILIFVATLEDGFELSQRLGIDFYRASSKDHPLSDEDRQAIYTRWLEGTHTALVASAAISAGNDYPSVRVVCHLGTPFDMITYSQQSGRGGRDGELAHCVIIPKGYHFTRNDSLSRLKGVEAMGDMIHRLPPTYPASCIRFNLGKSIDGVGFGCFDYPEDFHLCEKCELVCQNNFKPRTSLGLQSFPVKRLEIVDSDRSQASLKRKVQLAFGPATEQAIKKLATEEAKRAKISSVYSRFFDRVGNNCGGCYAAGKLEDHEAFFCKRYYHQSVFKEIRKNLRYNEDLNLGLCWFCHLPQGISNATHDPFERGLNRENCPHGNVMIGFVSNLWTNEKTAMEHYFRVQWSQLKDYISWLCQPHSQHRTNLLAIVAWKQHRSEVLAI
ncbi:helicase domain-containing protein [Coprinopsis cinerea AmutBmut pab1-1]|nr:helicase domain-containing protein [Coprinopsis cinerea AmutBmut pab1-1]